MCPLLDPAVSGHKKQRYSSSRCLRRRCYWRGTTGHFSGPPRRLSVVIPGDAGIRTGGFTTAHILQTGMTKNGEIIKPKQNNKRPSNPSPRATRNPRTTAISLINSSWPPGTFKDFPQEGQSKDRRRLTIWSGTAPLQREQVLVRDWVSCSFTLQLLISSFCMHSWKCASNQLMVPS